MRRGIDAITRVKLVLTRLIGLFFLLGEHSFKMIVISKQRLSLLKVNFLATLIDITQGHIRKVTIYM